MADELFYEFKDIEPVTLQDDMYAKLPVEERQRAWESGLRPVNEAWQIVYPDEAKRKYEFITNGKVREQRWSANKAPKNLWSEKEKAKELRARQFAYQGGKENAPMPSDRKDHNEATRLINQMQWFRENPEKVGKGDLIDTVGGVMTRMPLTFGAFEITDAIIKGKRIDRIYEGNPKPGDIYGLARDIVYAEMQEDDPTAMKVMRGVSELPAYAVDIALTKGLGGLPKAFGKKGMAALAKKLGEEKFKRFMASAVVKGAVRAAPTVTEAGIYAGVTDVGGTLAQALPQRDIKYDETTETGFAATEKDSWMNSLPKAVINQMSEYLVERVGGEALAKGASKIGAPIRKAMTPKPTSADVPENMKTYILNRIRQSWQRANPDAGPMASQIGFNGMIAELGEERVTELVQGANEAFFSQLPGYNRDPLPQLEQRYGMSGDIVKETGYQLGITDETPEQASKRRDDMFTQGLTEIVGIGAMKGMAGGRGTATPSLEEFAETTTAKLLTDPLANDLDFKRDVIDLIVEGKDSRSAFAEIRVPNSDKNLLELMPNKEGRQRFLGLAEDYLRTSEQMEADQAQAQQQPPAQQPIPEQQAPIQPEAQQPVPEQQPPIQPEVQQPVPVEQTAVEQQQQESQASWDQQWEKEDATQLPAPTPQPTPQPAAQLPRELRGAKPRYNYGQKAFTLDWETDVDKALYVVAQKKGSKRDNDYMNWLQTEVFPDKSKQEIIDMGLELKSQIKEMAKQSESGVLTIPAFGQQVDQPQQQPAVEQQAVLPQVEQNETQQQETKLQKTAVGNIEVRDIRRAFPGINIKEVDEGFRLDLSTGSVLIRLSETADITDSQLQQLYKDYSTTVDGFTQQFPTAGQYITDYRAKEAQGQFSAGLIRPPTKEQAAELNLLAVVDLNNTDWAKANANQVKVLKHEMVHFAFNTGMWNKSERDALVKQYSDTKKSFREQSEDIAMSAEVWEDQGMVQRIKNWVNRILSKLTGGKVELSSKAVEQLFKSEDFWQARPAEQMDVFMGQQKNITQGSPVVQGMADTDYRGIHTAPTRADDYGSLDNMAKVYPEDIYSPEGGRYYGDPTDANATAAVMKQLQQLRGKPDQMVTVYRGVPPDVTGDINPGDWVTTHKPYAEMHAQRYDEKIRVIEKQVRAGDLFSEGNSIFEFGWDPAKEDSDIVQGSPYRYANRQGNEAAREAVEDLNEQYDPQRIKVQNELDKIEKERASNPNADIELMQRLEEGSIEARDVLHADQLKDGIFNGGPVSLKQMAEFHKINKLQRQVGTQTAQTLAMFKEVNRNRKTDVQVRLDAITEGMLSVDEKTEELLSSIPEKMGEDFVVPDPQQPTQPDPQQPDPQTPIQPEAQQPSPPDPQQPSSTDGDMLDPNTPMPDQKLIGREAYQALLKERKRLQKITEFIEKLGYDTTNAGLNRLARDLESSVKVVDFINKTKRHKVRQVADVISEFRYAAMLSGPETQMVNAFSNATFSTWRELEQVMWAAANSTAGIFGQADPQQLQLRDYKQYGAAGITNALGSAFKHAFGAWANEYHGWHKNKLMEDKTGTAFKSKIEMEHTLPGRVRGKIRSVLGFGPMHMVDQFFKTLNAHMHVGVQAAMIARNTKDRGGLSEAELIEDLVANKQSPAWKRAMNEASLRMFQDTGKGASKVLIEAGDKLRTDSAAGFIVRHTVAPFVRTPVRITSQALVRLPGMPMLLPYKIVRNLLDGKPALKGVGSEAVSQVASTIIFALLLGLRNSEDEEDQVLTGAAKGHDSRERTYRYGKGVNPVMAMKLGDEWVSYDRQDPLAIIGATTIDGVDAIKKGDPTILGRSLAGQLHEKTFMRGISDLYTGVTEEKGGKRWAASMIGSFIPKLWGQTTRKFDPYVRDKDVDTIGKQALQRENLIDAPVIYDQWGFPAERSNDAKSFIGMRSKSAERFAGNRVIDNWNRLNPDEKTLTTPPRDTYTPTGKTERKMDRDGQYQEFKKVAGTLAREVVLKAIPEQMQREPSPVVLKITKNALEQARNKVKEHYERNVNFDIDMDRQVQLVLAKVVSSSLKIPKRPVRSNADTDEYALKDTKHWETYKEAVIEYRKWYAQNQSRIRR